MPETIVSLLSPDPSCASRQVGWFLAQLEDQSQVLHKATRDLTTGELEWQPAPGVNTIGMLLAHIAVAEVHLGQVGVLGLADSDLPPVLGIAMEDDGIPLPPDGAPPSSLRAREAAFFDDLLERARRHTRKLLAPLTDADLTRRIERPRPDGGTRIFEVSWVLYHMLEHQAGHQGQISLLRRMFRKKS